MEAEQQSLNKVGKEKLVGSGSNAADKMLRLYRYTEDYCLWVDPNCKCLR